MKILFFGNTGGYFGPDQVNRNYYNNLTENFLYVQSSNHYVEFLKAAWKMLFCKVVVVSGVTRRGCVLSGLSRVLGKKLIYIMHGCAAHEYDLNGIAGCPKSLRQERYMLKNADLLLPVSKKFRDWVKQRYPEYAGKTEFLYNGIELVCVPESKGYCRIPGSIIAAGGTDTLKSNDKVAAAVGELGCPVGLEIYGNIGGEAKRTEYENVHYAGTVSHDEFLKRLMQMELFVLNSVFETFSVTAVEALVCGCSVLISQAAGVTEILELKESDLIRDPSDQEEIKEKIKYLLKNPNNERILKQLDLKNYTYQKTVERLEEICRTLC